MDTVPSPTPEDVKPTEKIEEDDPMVGSGQDDEGEGDDAMGDASDDSSEEPEEDSDAERRVREGFIVDEDEDDDDEAERRRKHKRRRRHREREREREEDLEDDDLELLEENAGRSSGTSRLTRLRRGSSPQADERRKSRSARVVDDDDEDDLELPQVQDIQSIWDDERTGGREDDDDADLDDMDNFIDYEDDEDDQQQMNEQERRQKRQEAKQRMRANVVRGAVPGIDANAWDEIHEVFGDGHEYDWALEGDEVVHDADTLKPELKYQDVFEPSEITARFLTEDDDLIRVQDVPERMQLANSALSQTASLSFHQPLGENDLDQAAAWVLTRLGQQKADDFFRPTGRYFTYLGDLVQAITYALRFFFVHQFEVPYVWVHKKDYVSYFNPADIRTQVELLSLQDLWRVYALGLKYRALLDRKSAVNALYARLNVTDDYFENEIRKKVDTAESVADAMEWLNLKYREGKRDPFGSSLDMEEVSEDRKHKLPSRISAYDVARRSVISTLATAFGIKMQDVVQNYQLQKKEYFIDDHELAPEIYAEQFTNIEGSGSSADVVLGRARMMLATELGKDPLLRQEVRDLFKSEARVSCVPTERGIVKISNFTPWFSIKYLHQKPVAEIVKGPQFLHILAAEVDHCVTVTITLPTDVKDRFEGRLMAAFESDGYGDTARSWNDQRMQVVREALEQHLLPVGVKYVRDWLREETEDDIAQVCASILRERIDVRPYWVEGMKPGESPSVVAVSWGKGDYQKDDITLVYLDHEGRMLEHTRINNITDPENREELIELLVRREPEVIVIGGFSMATARLAKDLQQFLQSTAETDDDPHKNKKDVSHIKQIYVQDEVARLYQHSKRAEAEFGALPTLTKYCIGLARYARNPLNEYAALGSDITAISFDERHQHMIPKDKLLTALERTFVDVVNDVGLDINKTVIDSYHRLLLPYICGLGPRKAQALTQNIVAMGGTLVNRDQFIKGGLLTTKIFLNAAAFLRIESDSDHGKSSKHRRNQVDDLVDALDRTRVHPEDYELARKMAGDAQDADEEDVQDKHPSHFVEEIMNMDEQLRNQKLDELNLDDFAVNMYEANEDRKRHTLNLIKAELIDPFGDRRGKYKEVDAWQVLTMLSGQTQRTLRGGFIMDCTVTRISKTAAFVRLDSGIEGTVDINYVADNAVSSIDQALIKGKAYPGQIIAINLDLPRHSFSVEMSTRPADVKPGADTKIRSFAPDEYWDHAAYDHDQDIQMRKKRNEVGRLRRAIKHPNFHPFKSNQAENYLSSQQRGDVVIRPSSQGVDHLAVTWKVDDKLYQHLDVHEPNADPSGQTLGTRFIVEGRYEFSDLDELIVNHVSAMARRVEDLMAHEKFKHGEDELHHWLRQFVKAHPNKSIYGFTLNRKRPGHFNLCFLANASSAIQTWPVRVAPEAYYLFETPAAGVSELCDAFKVRHLHESQNIANAANSGKTPYGGRTPARTPAGAATPGRASVRQPQGQGWTPNTYGGGTATSGGWGAPPPVPFGAAPPSSRTPQAGFQTPSYTAAVPAVPTGMNPERARMIRNAGGGW